MTSEIRANTLKNRVGLGTVSFTNTGIVVSGIVTANSFSGPYNGTDIVGTGITLTSTDTGSSAGPELKLFRNSASPADADYLGQLKFAGESDTGVERNYAKITGKILDASNGTEDGILEFAHIKGGSQTITGRWRSDSLQLLNDTNLSVAGDTTLTGDLDVDGHTNLDNVSVVGVTTITANNVIGLNVENSSGSGAQTTIRSKSTVANASNFVRSESSDNKYIGLLKYGTGHSAYGALAAGGGAVYANSSVPITIMSDGGYINFATGGNTEKFRITSTGDVNIGGNFSQTDSRVHIQDVTRPLQEGTLTLSSATTTNGAADNGSTLRFHGHDGSSERYQASIRGAKENGTSGNYAGYLAFNTRPNGQGMVERLRIDSSGKISTPLGTTTRIGVTDRTSGTGAGGSLCVTAGSARGSGQNSGDLILASGRGNNSANAGAIKFGYNNGANGTSLDQEWLSINSSGQVSISSDGTTDGLLTIKGNSDATGTPSIRLLDGSDTREVSISNTSGDFVASVQGNDNAIHGHIKMFESGIIDFNNGGASGSNVNRLRIATDGNVHINMTDNGTASAKLNVEDSSSAGTNVLLISNKPSGANGKARMVFHTETAAGQGCSPYIQSVSGADAGPNANNNQNAGGFEVHTRSGGAGTDNNALRIRDDGSIEKYGAYGNILFTTTGSDIEFTRGGRNRFSATHGNGYFDFNTGGQYTFPAMRIFATPGVESGAKVGINTDTIGVDTQMSVMASKGKPALYTSYGIRIMPNGANSFSYPGHYITGAAGVYVIHMTIPANNTWTQVAAGRYHGATVTCRVGDASSKRTIFANYDFTAPNYGVAHYNEIANNGNWNTGSASMRVANAGTYDYALEVQHNSYYNTSNTSSVALIFNIC